MSLRTRLIEFVGDWSGINRLWISPDNPVRESETTATVALAARDAFVMVTYTWADLGEPQDGVLILRTAPEPSPLDMVWIDSWHTGGKFMEFRGEEDSEGRISVLGSYSAPPGPDWGWRIVLAANPDGRIQVLMYNISPDGKEALAVEAMYTRADAAQHAAAADRPSAGR